MADFNNIKRVFENKKEKGYVDGLTYNDYESIKKMKRQLSNMDQNNPEVRILLAEVSKVFDILLKNGGHHKFSKANREYILSHALLLPFVLKDSNRLTVDIVQNQPIIKCYFDQLKPITIRELGNVYVQGEVSSDRVEELYPEKTFNVSDYVSNEFRCYSNDALELLCRIYNYQLPKISKFHNDNLFKYKRPYKTAFTDDESYKNLLDILEYEKELLLENGYDKVDGMNIESLYDERKETIEIARGKEFNPNFTYEEPERVYLYRNK